MGYDQQQQLPLWSRYREDLLDGLMFNGSAMLCVTCVRLHAVERS